MFVYSRFNHRNITPSDCVPFVYGADVIKNKKQTAVMIINLHTSWLGLDVSYVTLHTLFLKKVTVKNLNSYLYITVMLY